MLQRTSITLAGSIESLQGLPWPREKNEEPMSTAVLNTPSEVSVKLPGGNVLSHYSRATFVIQDHGTVTAVELMPLRDSTGFRDAVSALEKLLEKWDAEPDQRAKQAILQWKSFGDLKPDPSLANFRGVASIDREYQAAIFFHIRPVEKGWYLLINVGVTKDEWREAWNLPVSRPATRPDN